MGASSHHILKLQNYKITVNRHRVFYKCLCTIFLLCFAANVTAELLTKSVLLSRMKHAENNLNYHGVFVFKHGNKLDAMSITHGLVDGITRERLVSLNGASREVTRIGSQVKCVWPQKQIFSLAPSSTYKAIPTTITRDLTKIKKIYTLRSEKFEQVAGKTCQVLKIRPSDGYRYAHELCIQPSTGMLLRSMIWDEDKKQVLEDVMFTQLEYLDDVNTISFDSVYDTSQYKSKRSFISKFKPIDYSQLMQTIDVTMLPEGFVVESASQRAMTQKQSPVSHIVLTDSIANVSIFISELEHEVNLKPMLIGRGAMNVFTRSNDRYKITVLGEVPSKTVEMIGASVKL